MTPDYCMDVNGNSSASGAAIIQYPCNYATNQQFKLTSVSSGKYEVVAVNSGLCVEPSGASTASGALLVQVACSTTGTDVWGITT
jgi:hypothetical protein